jgi:hypothetical protein
MEMMDFVAAMPLFAMSTLRITRLPPCAATYFAIASVAELASALEEDSAGAETAALAETSRPSGSAATRGRGLRATAGAAAWWPTELRSPRTAFPKRDGGFGFCLCSKRRRKDTRRVSFFVASRRESLEDVFRFVFHARAAC